MLLLVGVGALSAVIGRKLPSGFVPEEDNGYAIIGVQLPDAASLQRTKAVFKQVEEILGHTEGIRTYNTVAGFSFFTAVGRQLRRHGLHGLSALEAA